MQVLRSTERNIRVVCNLIFKFTQRTPVALPAAGAPCCATFVGLVDVLLTNLDCASCGSTTSSLSWGCHVLAEARSLCCVLCIHNKGAAYAILPALFITLPDLGGCISCRAHHLWHLCLVPAVACAPHGAILSVSACRSKECRLEGLSQHSCLSVWNTVKAIDSCTSLDLRALRCL